MTYRTGNHWGVTIVREGERTPEGHIVGASELVAVVVNGDQALAERICTLLNDQPPPELTAKAGPTEEACGKPHPNRPYTCQRRARHDVCVSWQSGSGADAWTVDYDNMSDQIEKLQAQLADRGTPDVDHTRGAAEALALVRRRLERDGILPYGAQILREVAAELGVSDDAPSGRRISPQAAERAPVVPASTPGPSEAECGCPVTYQRCRVIDHTAACSTRRSVERIARDLDWVTDEPADSCTCTIARTDPACPVHHGRRARGPKPPSPPGCICDGSGRTCPRHGAVL